MEENAVFEQKKELERLNMQDELFRPYEQPVYERVLDRPGLLVLDIGSNDGTKTAHRLSHKNVKTVIGLDHNRGLVDAAGKKNGGGCGGTRFVFCACDVERMDFEAQLRACMEAENVLAFDVIHLSFILMHMKSPEKLLARLKHVLAPDGKLLIVDVDDDLSSLTPDRYGLFGEFRQMLARDPFAGDRTCGGRLGAILNRVGYSRIVRERDALRADRTEFRKKEQMFEVFCSYLAEDAAALRERDPANEEYVRWETWLGQNYERLHSAVTAEDTEFSIGIPVITAAI